MPWGKDVHVRVHPQNFAFLDLRFEDWWHFRERSRRKVVVVIFTKQQKNQWKIGSSECVTKDFRILEMRFEDTRLASRKASKQKKISHIGGLPENWDKRHVASLDWWYSFSKRWNICYHESPKICQIQGLKYSMKVE